MVPAGVVSAHQLCFYDFLPTAAAIAGADDAMPSTIDGHSFLPTLVGSQQPQPPFVYHEYDGPQDPSLKTFVGLKKGFGQNVRVGNWSGVCVGPNKPCIGTTPSGESRFFLYDMSQDEAQLHDVAAQNPSVVARILTIMHREFNYSWDPATASGVAPSPTPMPGPNPSPSPCPTNLTGRWWGTHGHMYTATINGTSVTLATTDNCCAWTAASGTITGNTLHVTAISAPGKKPFTLHNIGALSADRCDIAWTERWAPWRRQS